MNTGFVLLGLTMLVGMSFTSAFADDTETDTFDTEKGPLTIYFLGHGTLMFDLNGYIIHVDPVSAEADYKNLPNADLVLITHEHPDHLDKKALKVVATDDTTIITNSASGKKVSGSVIMENGDSREVDGIIVYAVPAYNTTRGRAKFHPKGRDNGYILDMDGFRVYIAGDTEDIPEMNTIKDIDIAFLPVNQPYTMTPEQAVTAAEIIKPKVLYPYHYGNTNVERIETALSGKGIDVRIRGME